MSDFDAVLERLLSDPGFASALAVDATTALAGYQLSAAELSLLHTQVADDPLGLGGVEVRTSQSSLGGLLAPLPTAGGTSGFGTAPLAGEQALGTPGHGASAGTSGFGPAPSGSYGFGAPAADPSSGMGAAAEPGSAGFGRGPTEAAIPDGYHVRVDTDGDGYWDDHTLYGTADGGVDIAVDADRDGRVDFIGHDTNADGLVDWAEYDTTGDGAIDTRMYDNDGDGWMDRTEPVG